MEQVDHEHMAMRASLLEQKWLRQNMESDYLEVIDKEVHKIAQRADIYCFKAYYKYKDSCVFYQGTK